MAPDRKKVKWWEQQQAIGALTNSGMYIYSASLNVYSKIEGSNEQMNIANVCIWENNRRGEIHSQV